MERRKFIRVCTSLGACAPLAGMLAPAWSAGDATLRRYARVRLVDPAGMPLRAKQIPVERNFVFNYPYASTPCFLLNLGKSTKRSARLKTADNQWYEWQGGVGAGRSIVAYSAICAHQLAYPTREISFISYRAEASLGDRFAHVIHCCSEHSQYDPAEGGRVVAGPAPQALASIVLEYDAATDGLYALGTLGGEMFNQFFAKYEFRLSMEQGRTAHDRVEETCKVERLENYCRQQVRC
jgi:Rieske Fe-S protein